MELKDRLRSDLTAAMKARDELRTATLRMVLTAVQTEEVAGKTVRELTDAEVQAVLTREGKKRREAAAAFDGANRPELAARERAEEQVIADYLPQQLGAEELNEVVAEALTEAGLAGAGRDSMGAAMKAANARVAGRAEGGRVAAVVRRQLGLG
ncbi:MAG TPA: GatB/YqeY domain-containing protein [Mycobacteriales bacterium]|jgi:hypothetical protein|nr:GatB/YqeY domain-containing protein [Mycobacteriales bacterium]